MHPRKAVFISPIVPALSGNGLAMRMGLFVEALSRIAQVEIIVAPVAGGPAETNPFLQGLGVGLHIVPVGGRNETHFMLLSRIADEQARLEAFRAYGKPRLASFLSTPVLAEIAGIIAAKAPDLVHVGRSYMAPCAEILPQGTVATLDLDEDDLTSFSSKARLVRRSGETLRADWLMQEGLACDALIWRFGKRFQRVFVSSRREAVLLARRHPGLACETMENAVDIPARIAGRDDGATLIFVGSLSYAPNAEGILWFSREVMPRLRARGEACRLLIAGPQPPSAVSALGRHPRISVLGRLEEVGPLYRHATLALAPLRAGGGTRIKLLEAAAHRVASVSTPVGAEGLGWPVESGGWIAANAGQFAESCRDALFHPAERHRRAMLGLAWVRRHHSRENLVTRISRALMIA